MDKFCKECNEPFTSENPKRIFCSTKCKAKYNSRKRYLRDKEQTNFSQNINLIIPENTSMTVGEYNQEKCIVVFEYLNNK